MMFTLRKITAKVYLLQYGICIKTLCTIYTCHCTVAFYHITIFFRNAFL